MTQDFSPEPAKPVPAPELLSRAQLRGNIHWWPPDAALEAIDWYRTAGVAVIGADLIFLRDDVAQATMEGFDASPRTALPADWSEYVDHCAALARAFVTAHHDKPDAAFDLVAVTHVSLPIILTPRPRATEPESRLEQTDAS